MKKELLDEEVLYLTGMLKEYPANSFFADTAAELADCGYLRKSRSGLTYRLTEKGEAYINQRIAKDKYPLGRGKMPDRRIECGKAVLTMYRAGIKVFLTEDPVKFVPVFLVRRTGRMILGASQLIGLLTTETKTFLTYFADKNLKIDMEIAAARRFLPLLNAPEDLSAIIMCNDYGDVTEDTIPAFPYDVYAVACNDVGAKQLKFICSKDWREKLLSNCRT